MDNSGDRGIRTSDVAIIGLGAVFAGSSSYRELWDNILRKKDCITQISDESFNISDYYNEDPSAEDKAYIDRAGTIPPVNFDPMEFGIPPKSLEAISIQQLVSLVIARDTLIDASMLGKDAIPFNNDRIGVILGATIGSSAFPLYERLQLVEMEKVLLGVGIEPNIVESVSQRMKDRNIDWQEESFPGYLANVVAGRIANRFDFGGTNFTVDAACASGLCAIKQAVAELLSGDCDAVLTGGVCLSTGPLSLVSFSKSQAFSKKMAIRPYDSEADGMVSGDGIGMMVLKRLEDAVAAGDRIYSVIRQVGSSSDGKSKSIFAPNKNGQDRLLARCYGDSGVDPASIGLIEGHGTGTTAGDATEIAALTEIFSSVNTSGKRIALGSVKSQIGHTRTAAGAVGAIKTALALYNKIIPPTINVSTPHPGLDANGGALYLNTESRPWLNTTDMGKRSGAVSAFGFGGTNFHMVMEEYERELTGPYRSRSLPELVLLNAPDNLALVEVCNVILSEISQAKPLEIMSILRNYNVKHPKADWCRVGFVIDDSAKAESTLRSIVERIQSSSLPSWKLPDGTCYRTLALVEGKDVVAMFSGQGGQQIGMGKELCENYPEMRTSVSLLDSFQSSALGTPFSELLYPIESSLDATAELNRTRSTQPILAAFCAGLYKSLEKWGVRFDYSLGHSFGELTALWASGAMDDETLFRLSVKRGELLEDARVSKEDSGSMLAVQLSRKLTEDFLTANSTVYISNINSPSQLVLAGPTDAISNLHEQFSKQGIKSKILGLPRAFHTPYLASAAAAFGELLETQKIKVPRFPVFANLTGNLYPRNLRKIKDLLADQISNPVNFEKTVKTAHKKGGRVFIEIGPGRILAPLVDDILAGEEFETVSICPTLGNEEMHFRRALIQLRVLGVECDDDPYGLPLVEAKDVSSPSKISVELKGQVYMSDSKKSKRNNALAASKDLHQVSEPNSKVTSVPLPFESEENSHVSSPTVDSSDDNLTMFGPEFVINKLLDNQLLNSKAHDTYLEVQSGHSQILAKIAENQSELANEVSPTVIERAVKNAEAILNQLNSIQEATTTSHMRYLDVNDALISSLNQKISMDDSDPSDRKESLTKIHTRLRPEPSDSFDSAAKFQETEKFHEEESPLDDGSYAYKADKNEVEGTPKELLVNVLKGIVAEITGYPSEMLRLESELEADLGIDSIKRIEIFSELNEQYPDYFNDIDLEKLGQLTTLGLIVDELLQANTNNSEAATQSFEGEEIEKSDFEKKGIKELLLSSVSHVTGYPEDMIDLEMDLEADLGIDSIKRIEIFSHINELDTNLLNGIEWDDLNKASTLGAIIEYINSMQPESPPSKKKAYTRVTEK